MKTNTILVALFCIIIAILGTLLGYERTNKQNSAKKAEPEQVRKPERFSRAPMTPTGHDYYLFRSGLWDADHPTNGGTIVFVLISQRGPIVFQRLDSW